MPELTPEFLVELAAQSASTLFVGAGVGARVGLPTWPKLIEGLADGADKEGDSITAASIRDRAKRGALLQAASAFRSSDTIPIGRKLELIASQIPRQFTDAHLKELEPLICLGFSSITTTNYDTSLLDAYARFQNRHTPTFFGDSLRGAQFRPEFYVARIHGVVEHPESMVLDERDFERLLTNPAYLDYLLNILQSRPITFVGFSFSDPAIDHILSLFEDRFKPTFPKIHNAVLPSDSPLAERLGHLNIRTLTYDPKNNHEALWEALRNALGQKRGGQRRSAPGAVRAPGPPPSPHLHRFLAFTHAQVAGAHVAQPVVDLVREGIILSLLAEANFRTLQKQELYARVASALSLSHDEAGALVGDSLLTLVSKEQIRVEGETVWLVASDSQTLRDSLSRLANGVIARMRIRHGLRTGPEDVAAAAQCIEAALLTRAWDLAAHFAGSGTGWSADLRGYLGKLVMQQGREHRISGPDSLRDSLFDLFHAPDEMEASDLAALSRAAFALQLAVNAPRQSLIRKQGLPTHIYFDTNFVMPAITAGHPKGAVYLDILTGLKSAQDDHDDPIRLVMSDVFLNEILSHKQRADTTVRELHLENPEELRRHVSFFGATNVNVFIAAYATAVGRTKKAIGYRQFISEVAPYNTEQELTAFLAKRGIATVALSPEKDFNEIHIRTLAALENAYEEDSKTDYIPRKERVLIQHEARQLAQLLADLQQGRRPLFVTADNRLRRLCRRHPHLLQTSGMMMSDTGFAAFADVVSGMSTDPVGLMRLVWATPRNDAEESMVDLFVGVGLRNYSEGMGQELQVLAKQVAREAGKQAIREKIDLLGRTDGDLAKGAKFLDRVEKDFYKLWEEAVDKFEREHPR